MVQQTLVWLAAAALLASCTMAQKQAVSRKMLNFGLDGLDGGPNGLDGGLNGLDGLDTTSTAGLTGDSALNEIAIAPNAVPLSSFAALCNSSASSPLGLLPPVPAISDALTPISDFSDLPEYQFSDEDQERYTDLIGNLGQVQINVTPALVSAFCNSTNRSPPPPPATNAIANPFAYTYLPPPNPYLSDLSEYQLSTEDQQQLIAQLIQARFGDQIQINVTPPSGRKL